MKVKRDSLTILADILKSISMSKSARKMSIVYKANLNFERIERYLAVLVASGNVDAITSDDGRKCYRITSKGREFIVEYDRLVDSLNAIRLSENVPVVSETAIVPPS